MSFRQRATLESVCSLIADCPHSTPFWTETGFLVIRNQNIKNGKLDLYERSYTDHKHYLIRIRRAKPQFGDLIITREAPMGDVCMVPEGLECCVGQRQVLLRPNPEKVAPRFLLYAIQSPEVQHEISWSEGTGSTVSNVRIPVLKSIQIPLLPLKEQEEIAALLGAIDDRIALLRETNATLEAIAQALFKSWFVDFDPVHAKQQGRAPEGLDEATPARSTPVGATGVPPDPSAAAALFPDSFEESELGLVPKGWRIAPVGDVVESVGGGTPDTKEPSYWESGEYCWTTPKDLSGIQAPVLLTTERKLSAKGLAKVSSGLLPAGALLLSSRAPIGYLAIAQVPMAINQGYIAMLPNSQLPPLYMLFWCRQNMETIKGRANGSTFMEISKKAFRPIPILAPPAPVIDAFVDIAGALFNRLVENEKQAPNPRHPPRHPAPPPDLRPVAPAGGRGSAGDCLRAACTEKAKYLYTPPESCIKNRIFYTRRAKTMRLRLTLVAY